ncbi:endo-1,4-beta-xylanase [Rhodococcus sp. BUPNP1]|uniref:endo-1,4-beta-xylanase n=1 Tax=Rhodococcus sp. BUPNP1 TaxID=1432786 RepID=UPI001179D0BF|nr:endo-1,4-beta-xylanase [Rhodococcus sp. BUPNP1]
MTSEKGTTSRERVRISEPNEELYRVIIEQHTENGHVTFQAFMLTNDDKKDSNRSSFVQGKITDAKSAYENRSELIRKRKEAESKDFTPPHGTVGLTVANIEEVGAELGIDNTPPVLTAWDDSHFEDRPDDHAHVDFSLVANSRGQIRAVAKQLAGQADWKYKPNNPEAES